MHIKNKHLKCKRVGLGLSIIYSYHFLAFAHLPCHSSAALGLCVFLFKVKRFVSQAEKAENTMNWEQKMKWRSLLAPDSVYDWIKDGSFFNSWTTDFFMLFAWCIAVILLCSLAFVSPVHLNDMQLYCNEPFYKSLPTQCDKWVGWLWKNAKKGLHLHLSSGRKNVWLCENDITNAGSVTFVPQKHAKENNDFLYITDYTIIMTCF